MDSVQTDGGLTRRKILVAGTGTVLGASLLAACGDDGESGTSSTAGSSASGDEGGALAKVADIPVGGAVSATTSDGKPALVAQPTKGSVVTRGQVVGRAVAGALEHLVPGRHRAALVRADRGERDNPALGGLRDERRLPVRRGG